jgi:peptide/nickel transport system ATP-binding protein
LLDVLKLDEEELRAYRRRIQIIFQDPYSSLSPRMTVFDIISERWSSAVGDKAGRRDGEELMRLVGSIALPQPLSALSGGQRQRIGMRARLRSSPTC